MTNPIKVLIVEDDKFLRDLLSRKLLKENFEVEVATNSLAGLKKAKTGWPDIILLDLVLPNVDGFKFLSLIKQDEAANKIPVIVLSNLNQSEDQEKAKKLGASDYLVKALNTPDEIVARIKDVYSSAN